MFPMLICGTWVVWHVLAQGRRLPRVGNIVRVVPQGQIPTLQEEAEGFDTSLYQAPSPLDMLRDSYLVSMPNPSSGLPYLMWLQSGVSSLKTFEEGTRMTVADLDSRAIGRKLRVTSSGPANTVNVMLDGRSLGMLRSVNVEVDAENHLNDVTITLRGFGPALELQGVVLTVRPE
jgi:hypothetical protein